MQYFKDEKEFEESLEQFNALLGNTPIRESFSRYERTDIFGDTIKQGDIYYKRDNIDKYEVTASSLEKILFLTFTQSPQLTKLTNKLIEKERERQAKEMENMADKMW